MTSTGITILSSTNITLSQSPTVSLSSITVSSPFQPTNFSWTNNIATGGVRGSNPGNGRTPQCPGTTGGSALVLNACFTTTWCMDGNVLATATNGNVRPNTPFPGTAAYNSADPSSGSPHCTVTLKGNAAPLTFNDVGFVRFNGGSGGDYRLCTGIGVPSASCVAASPYINSANDGRPPGADLSLVNSNTAGVQ